VGLSEDINSAEFQHGVTQGFWELVLQERDKDLLYVRLHAPDERNYMVRLQCDMYGTQPIDGRFVDPVNLLCVASAWPQGNSMFEQWIKFKEGNGNLFICWDQDRGGIAQHPDWHARSAWKKSSNQLISYLDFLRQLLWLPARGYTHQ
jgi:hypothetical protein